MFFVNTIYVLASNETSNTTRSQYDNLNVEIYDGSMTCSEVLGSNLTKVIHACIVLIKVAAVIVVIVSGMLKLIPAITDKDAEGLKKVSGKLVKMAIILVIILVLPYLVRVLGKILGFDISCII